MSEIELKWLLNDCEEGQTQSNLLAAYYREVANGPMIDYREIIQSGNKQGQNYYVHVLDGINVFHKLRASGIVEINDCEERLLFAAYTIHDMNKMPLYGGRDAKLSYLNIVTYEHIRAELERIGFRRFFFTWEEYVEDIRLLMLLHQHDAAPLSDLDISSHNYALRYERLLELGTLMYAVDNLDLSHTLSERNHKQNFLAAINALSERRWRWVTHRLGENRGLLSNIIHNTIVIYLQERHTAQERIVIADLLYYPDGVAYLLPERETFTWSEDDTNRVALKISQTIAEKKQNSFEQFINPKGIGIKVNFDIEESGVSYTDVMYAIRRKVGHKIYPESKHRERNEKVREALGKVTPPAGAFATNLLEGSQPIIPFDQELLKRGELISAYRNLLHDHLEKILKQREKSTPWNHIYKLLDLPVDRYIVYNQIDNYQRGYFISCDCTDSLDVLFERFQVDLAVLTDEQLSKEIASEDFCNYLADNLEISGANITRDFAMHLQRYCKENHKQCCICSSPSPSVELLAPEVPTSLGVQVFSNRLEGGGREPKRNVCPICRTQFIVDKLTLVSFKRKVKQKIKNTEKRNNELYTTFYLHLYPYSFFTAPYLDAIYSTLKSVCNEDNQCLFLNTRKYFQRWGNLLARNLSTQAARQAEKLMGEDEKAFGVYPCKVNGISVPHFSNAVCNTPTLLINAFGENYREQFLFALTHALMMTAFLGCRAILSRTPTPLLTSDYMSEHALTFFADGIQLDLRWLLPTNEYQSIETYRKGNDSSGGTEYLQRQNHWNNESPDEQGHAACENIYKRLSALTRISQLLQSNNMESNDILLEIAAAMADDPLSVYYVTDLAIEKKIRDTHNTKTSEAAKSGKRTSKDKGININKTDRAIAPESQALALSKRIAPLLDELTKE